MSGERTSDAFSSGLFEDSTGHTIEDYPGEVENGYLLGLDESGGWYFNPVDESVNNYQLEGGRGDRPLELTLGFSMDREEVEDSFSDISELASDLLIEPYSVTRL